MGSSVQTRASRPITPHATSVIALNGQIPSACPWKDYVTAKEDIALLMDSVYRSHTHPWFQKVKR